VQLDLRDVDQDDHRVGGRGAGHHVAGRFRGRGVCDDDALGRRSSGRRRRW
jgi:hypothetical protein